MSALRSSALLLLGAAGAGALRGLDAGSGAGVRLSLLLVGVSVPVLVAAHAFAAGQAGAGQLLRRLSLGIGFILGFAAVGVGVVGALTLVDREDVLTVVSLCGFFGLLVFACGPVLAKPMLRDLDRVRSSLDATGEGPQSDRGFSPGSYAELDDVTDAGRAMVERLAVQEADREAAEVARRDRLVAFSHDLRTPLSSLRLLTEAIQDEVDPAIRRRYLRQLGTHVDALGTLVTDLFELARLEAGDVRWSMLKVAMDDIVAETVEAFIPAAHAKRIRLDTDIPPGLPPVQAAPEKLQRVLYNLLHNALRHTPADGRVTVSVRNAQDAVEVEVADTGDGIVPEERGRVFEAFYRRANGPAGAGAGLGLAISRGIVHAHGGRIWVAEAAPGTKVRFSVPRMDGAAPRALVTPLAQ